MFVLIAHTVYVNNHTSVWGSWYDLTSGQWGYACCHSFIHMSYCTGEAGISAAEASSAKQLLQIQSTADASSSIPSSAAPPSSMPPPPVPATDSADRKKKAEELYSKKRLGEGDLALDRGKLAQALSEERKRKAGGGQDGEDVRAGKKQKGGYEVSEEELGECLRSLLCESPTDVCGARRGIPDEQADDGGPDGELRRHGAVRGHFVSLPLRLLLYATRLFFCNPDVVFAKGECAGT